MGQLKYNIMKKNIFKISILILSLFAFIACGNDEDQVVPDFLDGTQYGVLLDVNVSSATEVTVAAVNDYTLTFDVNYQGENKRPVESIIINKTFTRNKVESSVVEQQMITEFPKTVTLTSTQLVEGFTNMTLNNLTSGDIFKIKFIVNYKDGGVTQSRHTNFEVNIK